MKPTIRHYEKKLRIVKITKIVLLGSDPRFVELSIFYIRRYRDCDDAFSVIVTALEI